ncbi:membrane protein YdbS with pleckstrin-like domain [Haloactinospora alba]|uniref:Membrane protein YdbS with pleckstrin-like domain n=1 Tax=Haloactinospora alba TaxID=405555 RepID=A0A543NF20_9ACTN|nr:PH domain-containing protein [Haloactinospora alba]TQN30360.1 membrane protein YdbS with pleckstrin-like domain [Haloactinospora alba]
MGIANRYLAGDEELVYVTRRHWSTLVGSFVALVLVIAAAAGLVWLMPAGEEWSRWAVYAVVAVGALAAVVVWFVPLLRWWTTLYLLSSRRLMRREGILAKQGHDMPLTRVNDVSFTISLWERLLGYGSLAVQSASEQEGMVLEKVPRVRWLQGEIYRKVNEAQRHEPPAGSGGSPPPPEG